MKQERPKEDMSSEMVCKEQKKTKEGHELGDGLQGTKKTEEGHELGDGL